MIKPLKIIVSLVILVCMFLPLSQCSMQTLAKVDENTGEVISPSETVKENIVVSELFLGEEAEVSFESILIPITFLIPLIFSLLPSFSSWKKIAKSTTQTLFSMWLIYLSYELVFTIGSPLLAGWVLISASCLFLIFCLTELVPLKHNKSQNNAPSGPDAAEDAAPVLKALYILRSDATIRDP